MGRSIFLSIAVIAAVLAAAGCSGGKAVDKEAVPRQAAAPRITQFYTSPDAIAPGESVLLCYGVENADRLSMEPAVENVRPVLSRCVPAKPAQTTTYTLTASGVGGTVSAVATVTVSNRMRPAGDAAAAKPSSLSLFADHKTVRRGQPVVLCYQAGAAVKVDIAPRTGTIALPATGCITEQPAKTTTYVLTAEFGDRRQERQEIEVRVE